METNHISFIQTAELPNYPSSNRFIRTFVFLKISLSFINTHSFNHYLLVIPFFLNSQRPISYIQTIIHSSCKHFSSQYRSHLCVNFNESFEPANLINSIYAEVRLSLFCASKSFLVTSNVALILVNIKYVTLSFVLSQSYVLV